MDSYFEKYSDYIKPKYFMKSELIDKDYLKEKYLRKEEMEYSTLKREIINSGKTKKTIKTLEFSEEDKLKYGVDKMEEIIEVTETEKLIPTIYKIKINFCKFSLFNLDFKLFDIYAIGRGTFYIKSIEKVKYCEDKSVFIIKLLNISYSVLREGSFRTPLGNHDINYLIKNEYYIVNNRGDIMDPKSTPYPSSKWICKDCEKCFVIIPYEWFYNPEELEKHIFSEK